MTTIPGRYLLLGRYVVVLEEIRRHETPCLSSISAMKRDDAATAHDGFRLVSAVALHAAQAAGAHVSELVSAVAFHVAAKPHAPKPHAPSLLVSHERVTSR